MTRATKIIDGKRVAAYVAAPPRMMAKRPEVLRVPVGTGLLPFGLNRLCRFIAPRFHPSRERKPT